MSPQIDQDLLSSGRAPEAIALFNAVFTSEVLVNACWSNMQRGSSGLPWPAAFLILPIALHPQTRESVPRDRRMTLARWAVRHGDLLADFDFRVANMVMPTKRAIRHGIRAGRLEIQGSNIIALARPKTPTPSWPAEMTDSVKAARFCGQWFNDIETHTAFELLGLGT
jgi:hypothetical protein